MMWINFCGLQAIDHELYQESIISYVLQDKDY